MELKTCIAVSMLPDLAYMSISETPSFPSNLSLFSVMYVCTTTPSSCRPNCAIAERAIDNVVSSGAILPSLIILLKTSNASTQTPFCIYPAIITLHEITSLSVISSNNFLAIAMLPNFAYPSISLAQVITSLFGILSKSFRAKPIFPLLMQQRIIKFQETKSLSGISSNNSQAI
ncbi:hypothetical protein HanRHA438_Chr03g0149341 [Helianthus annuus]|nr:hypothetical protein HanRHA438_Chr03g0149341 [Helianthus annuus]